MFHFDFFYFNSSEMQYTFREMISLFPFSISTRSIQFKQFKVVNLTNLEKDVNTNETQPTKEIQLS